ncbi:TnsA-like heteromeric transposase endonuclease subunit [Mycobacterium sp.]|uniref:TnsA-like heteromeric transposase endonuclease subunit n=1 Tax=Mycobacterium sp. TaxID=1785 RepID=UPI003F97CCA6
MSDIVSVDLSSAAVAYRPAAGEQRCVPAGEVSPTALFRAAPWRTFRWYFGQRHYSGTYWSATERDHVIYESRLELANLILADFDPSVHHIVAQPFQLTANVDGQKHRHILDYLWDSDRGPIVVDVVRAERMTNPRIVRLCAWTKEIVESLGWSYLVLNEPVAVRIANVRFLAGYRREWLANQDVLADLRCRRTDLVGRSIGEAEELIEGHPRALVRPALLSMLWRREFEVDLEIPLERSTVLESGS